MGTFTRIPTDTFAGLQLDTGILLTTFNPASPSVSDSDIICATSGGISIQCVANYSDLAEDVDNAPNNMMEFKKLEGWDCKISFTAISTDEDTIRLALGAADVVGGRVVPRRELQQADFVNRWWVGDLANGGYLAVKLINALSSGGFALQTTKNEKGKITVELTGHVSASAQNKVPMEIYVSGPVEYTVTNTLTKCTNSNTATKVALGQTYLAALNADSGYAFGSNAVTVTMGGSDVTSTVYDDGIIVIDSVSGALVITATATAV